MVGLHVGAIFCPSWEVQKLSGVYCVFDATVWRYQPTTFRSRRSARQRRSTPRAASAKPSWWRMRSTAGCGWAGACGRTTVTWVAELTSCRRSTGAVRVGEAARSRYLTRHSPRLSLARRIWSRTWRQPTAVLLVDNRYHSYSSGQINIFTVNNLL